MAKRFTDSAKWRNEWFRTLNLKAKISWVYLCDECDYCGIWKADFGLATFQIGFPVSINDFRSWFGDKITELSADEILIMQFFSFQYSSTKEAWGAKIKARSRLESLGFEITKENRVQRPLSGDQPPTVPPLSNDRAGYVEVISSSLKSAEKLSLDLESAYGLYPKKTQKSDGLKKAQNEIKTPEQLEELKKAIAAYRAHLAREKTKKEFIKGFGSFMSGWRDWLDAEAGAAEDFSNKSQRREFHL